MCQWIILPKASDNLKFDLQWKSEAKVKQHTHDLSSYYTKAVDGFSIDSIDCVWDSFDFETS